MSQQVSPAPLGPAIDEDHETNLASVSTSPTTTGIVSDQAPPGDSFPNPISPVAQHPDCTTCLLHTIGQALAMPVPISQHSQNETVQSGKFLVLSEPNIQAAV